MSCQKGGCVKACCSGGKMKIKIPQTKTIAMNSNVSTQAVTTTTTTILLLTPGPFSFNSNNGCGRCCYNYNSNANAYCTQCAGVYLITAFITLDTAPSAQTVTLALDLNNTQFVAYPLTGAGTSLSFSTTANLCATDRIQFRIYSTVGYTGNVVAGNISITRLGDRVNNCC